MQVDCQAGVGLVGSVTGGGTTVARKSHKALEDSIQTHFPGNHAINCMCHSTENIYQMRDSAVIRVSAPPLLDLPTLHEEMCCRACNKLCKLNDRVLESTGAADLSLIHI